jgi:hypothetical protein
MEKRDYCLDYIRGNCDDLKCKFGHVIVDNKEEFLKKHEQKVRIRISPVQEFKPSFSEIKRSNESDSKPTANVISKCTKCQKGFLVNKDLVERGDPSSIKCKECLKQK